MKRFEEMEVWMSARKLTKDIYSISSSSLFFKDYGLRNQIRRASVSIVSNIAEGFESQSNPSFYRYLSCAKASTAEVRAQLHIAFDLGYISKKKFQNLVFQSESIGRQLFGFINYLRSSPKKLS